MTPSTPRRFELLRTVALVLAVAGGLYALQTIVLPALGVPT